MDKFHNAPKPCPLPCCCPPVGIVSPSPPPPPKSTAAPSQTTPPSCSTTERCPTSPHRRLLPSTIIAFHHVPHSPRPGSPTRVNSDSAECPVCHKDRKNRTEMRKQVSQARECANFHLLPYTVLVTTKTPGLKPGTVIVTPCPVSKDVQQPGEEPAARSRAPDPQ